MKKSIYELSPQELVQFFVDQGFPSFRAKQLETWLYPQGVVSFDALLNMPKNIRSLLEEHFSPHAGTVVKTITSPSGDAMKSAILLADGSLIECVILVSKSRRTLCISSQVGCALGCVFCETGKLGLKRNLTVGEMIYQLVVAHQMLASQGERISNIVFMGMGEALSNFENFVLFLDRMDLFGIGRRKITVSTAGVVPSIDKLIQRDIAIGLAISLNASDDEERSAIMPINNRYPIAQIMEAARRYANYRGRPTTFEYVLIAGKNDSPEAAQRLIKLLKGFPGKLNVIPLNSCTTEGLDTPDDSWIDRFAEVIHEGGVTVTVRRSGGREIDGACGQLAGKLGLERQHDTN